MDQVELVLQTPTESTYINAQLLLILNSVFKFDHNYFEIQQEQSKAGIPMFITPRTFKQMSCPSSLVGKYAHAQHSKHGVKQTWSRHARFMRNSRP